MPVLVPKGERRTSVLNDQIISLYARGLTLAEIQGHLEDMYGTQVSPTLISTVTDAVKEWTKPIKDWRKALNQFAILFEGRLPNPYRFQVS